MKTCGGITAVELQRRRCNGEPTDHGDLRRNYSGDDATGNQPIMKTYGGITAADGNQLW